MLLSYAFKDVITIDPIQKTSPSAGAYGFVIIEAIPC